MKLSTLFTTLFITSASSVSGKDALLRRGSSEPNAIPERRLTSSILELASATPELSNLTSFLTAAGFPDEFPASRTFTVFAPTNSAFAKLPPDTVAALQADVLDYHIINGTAVMSEDLEVGLEATTLEGSSVTVTSLTPPMINNANIIEADIQACNGVIHIIDTVLIPPPEAASVESDEDP